jgi:hypothetical protein
MRPILEPVTYFVETQVKEKIMALERDEQISLYRNLMILSVAVRVAGLVFGSLGRLRLQQGITLKLLPMAKRPLVQGGKRVQWEQEASPVSIFFPPNEAVEFEVGMPTEFEFQPDQLYVPYSTTNRMAFDSFIITGRFFYIFQTATSYCIFQVANILTNLNSFMTLTKVSKTSFQKKCCVRSRRRKCGVSCLLLPPVKRLLAKARVRWRSF